MHGLRGRRSRTETALKVILFLAVVIAGCRHKPQQVRLERRWLPGVYVCEARDQVDMDTAMRAYGGGTRTGMRMIVTELAELMVGEADSSGSKRLEWRPRRMTVVRHDPRRRSVCDSESEFASPTCWVPRAVVKTVYTGHVNRDGTAIQDGIAHDDGTSNMWAAFQDWRTGDAEWEISMGDLRRVLNLNFGLLNGLPRVVSPGDRWSSSSTASVPAFGGLVEVGYQHEVESIDGTPGEETVKIVSTVTGGLVGRSVALGKFSGNVEAAALRATGVFDVSLGMVTSTNNSASGKLDLDFGPGVTGTLDYRVESTTTCRKAAQQDAPDAR